jgi:hypothetical protein
MANGKLKHLDDALVNGAARLAGTEVLLAVPALYVPCVLVEFLRRSSLPMIWRYPGFRPGSIIWIHRPQLISTRRGERLSSTVK